MKIDWKPRRGYYADPFTYEVIKRLKADMNTMTASLGYPRRGKSNSQFVVGESVDVNGCFGHTHITFLPGDYIKAIRDAKPGCYIVFDEPGAEWSARSFMSIANQMLNATHITFGSKLVNVGWAVPVMKMQDVNTMRLLTYFFWMLPKGPKGIAKFYTAWVNAYTGKPGRTGEGKVQFGRAFQDKPEEAKEYNEMKQQYQDSSYERYYKEFQSQVEDDAKEGKKPKDLQELVQVALTDKTVLNSRGRIDRDLVSMKPWAMGLKYREIVALVKAANSFFENGGAREQ